MMMIYLLIYFEYFMSNSEENSLATKLRTLHSHSSTSAALMFLLASWYQSPYGRSASVCMALPRIRALPAEACKYSNKSIPFMQNSLSLLWSRNVIGTACFEASIWRLLTCQTRIIEGIRGWLQLEGEVLDRMLLLSNDVCNRIWQIGWTVRLMIATNERMLKLKFFAYCRTWRQKSKRIRMLMTCHPFHLLDKSSQLNQRPQRQN